MAYKNNNNKQVKFTEIPIYFKENSYVNEAEQVILELKKRNFKNDRDVLTTSQLRKLLSLTSALYDEVRTYGMEKAMDRIHYLRIQFVYQSGRNAAVKDLIDSAQILDILSKIEQNQSKEEFIRFCQYMEALVAYFKFYGGQD